MSDENMSENMPFSRRELGKLQTARANADTKALKKALPELRDEHYAAIVVHHQTRVRLAVYHENEQRQFEYLDGRELEDIRFLLTSGDNVGSGMWTRYLQYCGLPERTARERIQKFEGRYERAFTKRIAADTAVASLPETAPETVIDQDAWPVEDEGDERQPAWEGTPEQESEREAETAPVHVSYSVEQWASLRADERQAAIAAGWESAASLNGQSSDSIEWAQWSWNPVTGCRHNCPYCYARDIANRFYAEKFVPTFRPDRLGAPLHQRVPAHAEQQVGFRNIFTCSMADLFGKWVPAAWIETVLDVARACPQWNFLFLTKFPNRLAEFEYPDNAWLGTTVDCQARVKNAEHSFAKVKGGVKWLSIEPMLEPLQFDSLEMFNWVVIGGASASSKTPAWIPPRDWVDDLEHMAREAGCMIYEKTNLGIDGPSRRREYPGRKRTNASLPQALAYLPSLDEKGSSTP